MAFFLHMATLADSFAGFILRVYMNHCGQHTTTPSASLPESVLAQIEEAAEREAEEREAEEAEEREYEERLRVRKEHTEHWVRCMRKHWAEEAEEYAQQRWRSETTPPRAPTLTPVDNGELIDCPLGMLLTPLPNFKKGKKGPPRRCLTRADKQAKWILEIMEEI